MRSRTDFGLAAPASSSNGGTTSGGGAFDYGTIYAIASDGRLTTLYNFRGPDGARPMAGLTQANDGFLYGTAQYGGSGSGGTDGGGNLKFSMQPTHWWTVDYAKST